jgi:alpha-beta hydrolase superfamily lysophospholipase
MRRSARAALRVGLAVATGVALSVAAGAAVARRAAGLYEGPDVPPDPALDAVSSGELPGWSRPAGDGTRWAVFLPGLGSHPLRHQEVAAHLADRGYSVLLAAHSARWPAPRHAFGLREEDEARAWLRFVAERGAQEVVLFGWSFGASLWLRVLAGSSDAPNALPVRIRAVVLTGPLSDWSDAIGHGVGGGVLGRVVAGLAAWTLRVPVLARLAGQPSPVRIARPSLPTAGPAVPTLVVVHSEADRTVPLSSSRRLVRDWPGAATLRVVAGARHGAERDTDPTGWLDAVDGAV